MTRDIGQADGRQERAGDGGPAGRARGERRFRFLIAGRTGGARVRNLSDAGGLHPGVRRVPLGGDRRDRLGGGCGDGLTEVSYTSQPQTLPAGPRAHVFGLSATVENLGFGVGMIVVAAALDRYSPLTVAAWSHGAAVVVAVVFLVRVPGARGRAGARTTRSPASRAGPGGPER